MTRGVLLASRTLTGDHGAYLIVDSDGLTTVPIEAGQQLSIRLLEPTVRYCTGWYDIEQHRNHSCDKHAVVAEGFQSCFTCREKTDFNPAFYNATTISAKQTAYNLTPHSVYVAYFGAGHMKAGIMADSRGLERVYEQGALWYSVVEQCDNAYEARKTEERLIKRGLKNSITKKQKAGVLAGVVDKEIEEKQFGVLCDSVVGKTRVAHSLLDHFFFGEYPKRAVLPLNGRVMSGVVRGVVGQYLVLENNDLLYGVWLGELYGYAVVIGSERVMIDRPALQTTLF